MFLYWLRRIHSYGSAVDAGHENEGFTLIELSIVLVIIGLIVGGVLVGRDLISAAAARAQISQIEKYQQAVNTFRGKYGYLPGDMKDPDASQFGFKPRGLFPGEGDGNGFLEGVANNTGSHSPAWQGGESTGLWVDLSTAHLINESLTTAVLNDTFSAYSTGASLFSSYLPTSKLSDAMYVLAFSYGGVNYYEVTGLQSIGNGLLNNNYVMSGSAALAMDKKVDDGLPMSGAVLAMGAGGLNLAGDPANAIVWISAPVFTADAGQYDAYGQITGKIIPLTVPTPSDGTVCFGNNNTASAPMQYVPSATDCAVSFKFN